MPYTEIEWERARTKPLRVVSREGRKIHFMIYISRFLLNAKIQRYSSVIFFLFLIIFFIFIVAIFFSSVLTKFSWSSSLLYSILGMRLKQLQTSELNKLDLNKYKYFPPDIYMVKVFFFSNIYLIYTIVQEVVTHFI